MSALTLAAVVGAMSLAGGLLLGWLYRALGAVLRRLEEAPAPRNADTGGWEFWQRHAHPRFEGWFAQPVFRPRAGDVLVGPVARREVGRVNPDAPCWICGLPLAGGDHRHA